MTGRLAVFRAASGSEIGGGHLMRCRTLAAALEARGWRTAVAPSPCDLLVLDDYGLDAAFEKECRSWAARIMVIDDGACRDHDCDLLLDANPASDWRGRIPARTCLLQGMDYVLLRPEFLTWRDQPRTFPPRAGRLLVILGAGNAGAAGPAVMERLRGLALDAVDWVVGPFSTEGPALAHAARALGLPVSFHRDPPDLPALMTAADLAVTAAGGTSWELAFLGVPMVTVVLADNQVPVAKFLAGRGAARDAGEALSALIGDGPARRHLSEAGRALIDGKGADRVAAALDE